MKDKHRRSRRLYLVHYRYSVTSAGRLQSDVDTQIQLFWLAGFPSDPGTLPGVWQGLHQTFLQHMRHTWLFTLLFLTAPTLNSLYLLFNWFSVTGNENLSIRPALCHLLVRPNITSDTIQKIVLNIFIAPHTRHVIWTDLCIDNILKCYVNTNVWFFFHHIPFSVLYRPNLTCTMLQPWPETMKQTSKTSVSVNNRYQLASRRWVWCSVRRRVL